MELNRKDLTKNEKLKAVFCISFGTGIGLIVYGIFLYFHIDIYGWNLGLIFAPLAAGYAETILANRILGEDIGAISAFILFIDTTFYSFILKNPTLGWNLITIGSILVILQAAFPTLINYILLVVVGGILSNFIKTIKKYERKIQSAIKHQQYVKWDGPDVEEEEELIITYDKDETSRNRTYLGSMKYTADEMSHRIGDLSGGQKAKLLLLKMSMEGSNVLILDEPTRNFSPLSNPVIRQMLRNFQGAILTVSHDRKYIAEVADTVYELTERGLVLQKNSLV